MAVKNGVAVEVLGWAFNLSRVCLIHRYPGSDYYGSWLGCGAFNSLFPYSSYNLANGDATALGRYTSLLPHRRSTIACTLYLTKHSSLASCMRTTNT